MQIWRDYCAEVTTNRSYIDACLVLIEIRDLCDKHKSILEKAQKTGTCCRPGLGLVPAGLLCTHVLVAVVLCANAWVCRCLPFRNGCSHCSTHFIAGLAVLFHMDKTEPPQYQYSSRFAEAVLAPPNPQPPTSPPGALSPGH